jgi:hypothetical protein
MKKTAIFASILAFCAPSERGLQAAMQIPTILAPIEVLDDNSDDDDGPDQPKKRKKPLRSAPGPSKEELELQKQVDEHLNEMQRMQKQIDELRNRGFMPGAVPSEPPKKKLESPFKDWFGPSKEKEK